MTIPGSTQSVFISYSRVNRPFVETLIRDLETHGIQVWIDQKGLVAGTPDWEQTLRDAIRGSSAVLLIASPASRQSRYVKDELRIAEMYKRAVYPVWIDGDDWMDAIPMGWGGTQSIDARGDQYAPAVTAIVHALGTTLPPQTAPVEPSQIDNPAPEPMTPPRNPYKGLRSFTDDDAGDFFGREKVVGDLVEILRATLLASESPRFLAVIVGPSGSGKSSVVMAGLLPKLRKGALPGSDQWLYLDPMVPGVHPLERLTIALSGVIPSRSMDSIREDLDSDSARGLHLLASRAANIAKHLDRRLVLLVDQFEELFTLTTNEDERRHFIDLLVNAVTEPQGAVFLILTLRADFYDRPMGYAELGKLVESASKSVLPMDIDDLRAVIEKPAVLPDVRLRFDDGLVGDLLFEVRGEPAPLPLLQFTLDQLFERRDGRRLTRSAYLDIGGVKGALAKHAEATYAALPSDDYRRLARALFLRLIEPGATPQDTTRRRAALNELTLPDPEQTRLIQACTDRFVKARLLTTDEIGGSRTIEVSHEALIREWARLGDWLREAREDIRFQGALSQDATDWLRSGQRADDLYRGQKLIDAQNWAARNVASVEEAAFIEASRDGQQAQELAERDRQARELELAKRAETAERDRAVRFEEAAKSATRRARIAALAVFIAIFIISIILIFGGQQVASLQSQLAQGADQANQIGTLVPILVRPPQDTRPTLSYQNKFATATAIGVSRLWTPFPTQDRKGAILVEVPPGCFLMGDATQSDANPITEICFDKLFWIDKFDVTNKAFDAFVKAGGYTDSSNWTASGLVWRNMVDANNAERISSIRSMDCAEVSNTDEQPVVCITWYEAYAYCHWRGARLPTEAEWEYAARGPASRVYPWGNSFKEGTDDDKAAYIGNSAKTVQVGSKPNGASWVGALDMSGNVWQWVNSFYSPYPYDSKDGRENDNYEYNKLHNVVRGGAWDIISSNLRATVRFGSLPNWGWSNIGVRCAHFS